LIHLGMATVHVDRLIAAIACLLVRRRPWVLGRPRLLAYIGGDILRTSFPPGFNRAGFATLAQAPWGLFFEEV
jgi:hypothetical protein